MLRKLMSLGMVAIISASLMVGCSTTEQAVDDAKQAVEQNSLSLNAQFGKVIEVNENNRVLVVKVEMENGTSGDGVEMVKRAFSNAYHFTEQLDLSKYDELQYWGTVQLTDGTTSKEVSFSIKSDGLKQMSDLTREWKDMNQMAPIVLDFWTTDEYKDDLQVLYTYNQSEEQTNNNNKNKTTETSAKKGTTTTKKQTNKNKTKKNTKDDNYDEDGFYTGVKDGTHLGEIGKEQDEQHEQEESTCDFCGVQSNSVERHGNYKLCVSCYSGVKNSEEGESKLYE